MTTYVQPIKLQKQKWISSVLYVVVSPSLSLPLCCCSICHQALTHCKYYLTSHSWMTKGKGCKCVFIFFQKTGKCVFNLEWSCKNVWIFCNFLKNCTNCWNCCKYVHDVCLMTYVPKAWDMKAWSIYWWVKNVNWCKNDEVKICWVQVIYDKKRTSSKTKTMVYAHWVSIHQNTHIFLTYRHKKCVFKV